MIPGQEIRIHWRRNAIVALQQGSCNVRFDVFPGIRKQTKANFGIVAFQASHNLLNEKREWIAARGDGVGGGGSLGRDEKPAIPH